MGLITTVITCGGAIVLGVFINLVSGEVEGWTPKLLDRLLHRAARRLPEGELRERLIAEWANEIADKPGLISKAWCAFDAARGAKAIARDASGAATWAEKALDYLSIRGARIVPHFLFKILEADLTKRLPPDQVQIVLCEVRSRLEPQLRDLLRKKLRHFGNYQQTADEVQGRFLAILADISRGVQQAGLVAIPGMTRNTASNAVTESTQSSDPPSRG